MMYEESVVVILISFITHSLKMSFLKYPCMVQQYQPAWVVYINNNNLLILNN